jgi:type VI protein secretion system component VasF
MISDAFCADLCRLLGLLQHAEIHLERRNHEAVREAVADAISLVQSVLDEARRAST